VPHFTDAKGDKWVVEITIGTIRRIKRSLNADFGNPLVGNPAPLTRFHLDIAFIVDVIFVVCEDELKSRGITDLEFAERFSGDASYTAYIAFLEALGDFFQQARRPEVTIAIQKMQEKVAKAVEMAAATVQSPEFDQEIDAVISGQLSTSTPESSASTPDPSPGGS
jgi:hypothetical protein